MIEIARLVDRARADLPGAPVPLLNRIAIEAARQLCRDGRLWRMTFTPEAVDGVYPLAAPDDAVLHDIERVTQDGQEVACMATGTTRGPSQGVYTRVGDTIQLLTAATGALRVTGVLIPSPDADHVPDVLYNEWAEALEHAIKADAMLRPAEWGNPDMGLFHQRAWMGYRAKARSYGRAGGVTARRRVVDPWARGARA